MDDSILLISGECELHVLCTLLEQCEYFTALFSSGMKESLCGRVTFDEEVVTPVALKLIIDYLEEKPIHLSDLSLDVLRDLACAAAYLQVPESLTIDIKQDLFGNRLDPTSCDNIEALFMDLCEYEEVSQVVERCRLSKFMEYYKLPMFLDRTLPQVLGLLTSDELVVNSELHVVYAGLTWLSHHLATQVLARDVLRNYARQLLESARFVLVDSFMIHSPAAVFYKHCEQLLTSGNYRDPKECEQVTQFILLLLRTLIDEAKAIKYDPHRLLKTSSCKRFCFRNKKSVFLTIGGFSKDNKCAVNHVDRIKESSDFASDLHFTRLNSWMFPFLICKHCACVVDDIIYVIGGQRCHFENGHGTTNKCFRFDPRFPKWIEIPSMEFRRSLFSLCVLDRKLFAVGGWVGPNRATGSLEIYDVVKEVWSTAASLPYTIHEHKGCVLHGSVYISGAFKAPRVGQVAHFSRYDPDMDAWTSLAPMHEARSYHVMVASNDDIVVCGGVSQMEHEEAGCCYQNVRSCEVYSVTCDQWTVASFTLMHPTAASSPILRGDTLYILGGYSFKRKNRLKSHRRVQVIDMTQLMQGSIQPSGYHVRWMRYNRNIHFECVRIELPNRTWP